MRTGFFRHLLCSLFGCRFQMVDSLSAPPIRMVLLCSRCLFTTSIRAGQELLEEIAKERIQARCEDGRRLN